MVNKYAGVIAHMESLLTKYSEVESTDLKWLWYPYIAFGDLTIIQGSKEDEIFRFITRLAADISRSRSVFEEADLDRSNKILFQSSLDHRYIKSRLDECEANPLRIAFIEDSDCEPFALSIDDIVKAIPEYRASVCILNPLGAYSEDYKKEICLSLTDIRKLQKASRKNRCAMILVGRYQENSKEKEIFNSSYSSEVIYAARSVLNVRTDERSPSRYFIRQIKNNLAEKAAPKMVEALSSEEIRRRQEEKQKIEREQEQQRIAEGCRNLEKIGFPKSLIHVLARAGYYTMEEMIKISDRAALLRVRGIGPERAKLITDTLAGNGYDVSHLV